MSGRVRGLWPFAAAGIIAGVTVAGLVTVWRSPHPAELEGFVGFALSVVGIAASRIAWVWRQKSSQGSGVVPGNELRRLADLLAGAVEQEWTRAAGDRKSTRLNSSHVEISYAVFCLKKKKKLQVG